MPGTPKPHEFTCRLRWTGAASGPTTTYREYSRALAIEIAGKPALPVSSAPPFLGDAALHNPEDLLMAALSTCHCLSYLALASRSGILVADYTDEAWGIMEYSDKSYQFTRAVLKPVVTVKKGTDLVKARALHEEAHATCFIARSVNFPVTNEPVIIEAME
jgi:organic hydroperoxide reductase OsmC/OhrA